MKTDRADWADVTVKTLDEVCRLLAGNAWNSKKFNYSGNGIPLIRIQNVGQGTEAEMAYWDHPYDEKYLIRKGDILLSLSGSFRVCRWSHNDALLNQRVLKIEANEEIDSSYLLRFLEQQLDSIEKCGHHALVNNVRVSDIRQIKIPLPPLPEQKRIADILDKADAIRRKRAQALELTDQFLQSVFLDMFGDPVTNPKGWEVHTLGDLTEKIQIGPFGSQLHKHDYVVGGVPLVNPKHMVDGRIVPEKSLTVAHETFDTLPQYHLREGDIIMARRGEMGRCALITARENGWFCGTGSLIVRPKGMLQSDYAYFVLTSNSMRARLEGASLGITMNNLNKSIVEALQIPLPPLDLQKVFSLLMGKHLSLVDKLVASEHDASHLFESLVQRAFRGEL